MAPRERIREAVKNGGVRAFAREVGMAHTSIRRILQGDKITYKSALKLSRVLKCSWRKLCEEIGS